MEKKFIPLSVPNLKGKELEYVSNAITTEWVSTGGKYIDEFEENIAKYVGAEGAVACQNGTSGIHIALKLCGVTSEDEVIVPTLTFIAAVNPVKYLMAEPIFMDCDDSLTMDCNKLEDFCSKECIFENDNLINRKTNKIIKAIIVVHVFGNIANMDRIMQISEKYNIKVIEDATEALGSYYTEGEYRNRFAGTIGDIGVYSFNGNKIITTGGGGMIVSNNIEYLKEAKHLTTQAKSDELYYTHDEVGYNYRMTNIQAAMGLAQLEQLETFIEHKKKNYLKFKKEINCLNNDFNIIEFNSMIRPNYWFYGLEINKEGLIKDDLIKLLHSKGIQTRPIWGLIHEQKPYLSNQNYKIEKAKKYLDKVINIPCSSNLSEDDVEYIIDCIKGL